MKYLLHSVYPPYVYLNDKIIIQPEAELSRGNL